MKAGAGSEPKRRQPSPTSRPRRPRTVQEALRLAEAKSVVGRWTKKRLQILSDDDRLASINDLRLARSYVDMHREKHRLVARYARLTEKVKNDLESLVAKTPDYCSTLRATLEAEELPERLRRVAATFAAMRRPAVRSWCRETPDPYVRVLARRYTDGFAVCIMDGPMPLQQQEALEAQRHGRRVYDRLRHAGVPTGEASRLTREGLRIAGVRVDRAVRFDWRGATVNKRTLALQDQPTWLHGVAVGGAKQKVSIDVHTEVNRWLEILESAFRVERKRDWDPVHSAVLEAISRELKAHEAPGLSEKDRVAIRRRIDRTGIPDRALARRLVSRATGLSTKQIGRRDMTSDKK